MAADEQLTFADDAGRFYSRVYSIPPVAGRLLGYLAVCEPGEQTINDLADALLASRSAITGAVKLLESLHAVRRTRTAGERVDRVAIDPAALEPQGFRPEPYLQMSALARGGLAIVKDPVRRAMLEEAAALGDFLAERMPQVLDDWQAIRAKLGRLPAAQGTATASAAPGRTRPRTRHRRLAPPENIRRSSPQPDGARVITNPDQAAHGAG